MTALSDSFLLACKYAYLNNLRPFSLNMYSSPYYTNIEKIATELTIRDLYGYFLEYQYYIDFWAAFFILNNFKPSTEEMLLGLNSDTSIVAASLKIIDGHAESLDTKQISNYNTWLTTIKTYYSLV